MSDWAVGRRWRGACIVLAAMAVCSLPGGVYAQAIDAGAGAAGATKAAVPSGPGLVSANALVLDVYKDDLATAKTAAQKSALAGRILESGSQEKQLTNQYAMLAKARALAVDGLDAGTAVRAIQALGRFFAIDVPKAECESLTTLARTMTTPEERGELAAAAKKCVADAMAVENYAAAKVLADLRVTAARGSSDAPATADAISQAAAVRDVEIASNDVKRFAALLAEKPDDPEANFSVGKFRCFYKGDWKTGLPNLAAGSDKALADLAQKDLADATAPMAQMIIGDGWWDAAQAGTAATKTNLLRRSRLYYTRAVGRLTGLEKAKVEKRLKETETLQESDLADQNDFVANLLKRIPPEFLPAKEDKPTDLQTKSAGLHKWLGENPLVDPAAGVDAAFDFAFAGTSTLTLPVPMAPGAPAGMRVVEKKLKISFQDQFKFKGIPCKATYFFLRPLSGTDDFEIKKAGALEMGGIYALTVPIAAVNITLLPASSRTDPKGAVIEQPQVLIELVCGSGHIAATLRSHAPAAP